VPVWINIRTTPVPDLPCLEDVLHGVALDDRRYVRGGFSQGFFLRSAVVAADGRTLLNPQSGGASLCKLLADGHFAYAQVKPEDYLRMLRDALARSPDPSSP
jgi:hypothetical protein